jgi:hypothetical protein
MKESLEPLAGGLAVGDLDGLTPGLDCSGGVGPGEEDIVVDAIDSTAPSGGRDGEAKEFVLGPEQALGLDQAVLQSIDRCRKLHTKMKINLSCRRVGA